MCRLRWQQLTRQPGRSIIDKITRFASLRQAPRQGYLKQLGQQQDNAAVICRQPAASSAADDANAGTHCSIPLSIRFIVCVAVATNHFHHNCFVLAILPRLVGCLQKYIRVCKFGRHLSHEMLVLRQEHSREVSELVIEICYTEQT